MANSRIVIEDPSLEVLAAEAAADFEGVLGERPAVQIEEPAPLQLDGGALVILVEVANFFALQVASGAANAAGADLWQSIKRLFRRGVGKAREGSSDGTRVGSTASAFELRVVWGDSEQYFLHLKNRDLGGAEDARVLDHLTEAQLRPFEEVILPTLRWWDTSSDPPTGLSIKAELGQDRDHPWHIRASFGNKNTEPMMFSVSSDGRIHWIRRTDRAVPRFLIER